MQLSGTVPHNPIAHLEPETRELLRRNGLLLPLVEKELARQRIIGVALSPEQAQQAWDSTIERLGLQQPQTLAAYLQQTGLTEEELRLQAETPYRLAAHSLEAFGHQAESRFLQRKNELDRVVYSLLRHQDPFLARELYLRIKEGEAHFADLAASYSMGPERNTHGIVGPVPMNQAHPKLAELLRCSPPSQLHEPIQIENWWLVVRLESYSPASFDQSMAQQMSLEMLEQSIREDALQILKSQPAPQHPASISL